MYYREYENFDILEVAQKCGLQIYPHHNKEVEFKALCPFCGDTKYHLGLNRQKGFFHCFKCGEKGNSISLYAKIYGLSNGDAYKALANNEDLKEKNINIVKPVIETPMRTLAERHDVYYDFLSLLRLSQSHRNSLRARGLTEPEMLQFMYRSVPLDPVFRRSVLEKLASRHNLDGIPGFYVDEAGRTQMYLNSCGGIFIPVCNHEGYIQGLQMRLDVSKGSPEKKFRWFSSRYFPHGTGAKPWIHVVGDTTSGEAMLTEGAMKGDIASVLTQGKLFIAVPGVNAIEYLPDVMQSLNISKVYETFDMDKSSNAQVKKALLKLHEVLDENGIEYKGCKWNPKYNGIDDYAYAKSMYLHAEPLVA